MAEIIRNRTIRPSSRLESSKSYKIDTKNVSVSDVLIVNIDHESLPFQQTYHFKGEDLANKNSISFRVNDYGNRIDISWSGAEPISQVLVPDHKSTSQNAEEQRDIELSKIPEGNKIGFDPIVNENSKILILGTFPGNESLKKREYYANPRNIFWPMIFYQTRKKPVFLYKDKLEILQKNGIAIWDVCKACMRDGSLDSEISEETPNDILGLLTRYPQIKTIAFNGQKAAELFKMHFGTLKEISLIELPSTSPANAGVSLTEKQKKWKQIIQ